MMSKGFNGFPVFANSRVARYQDCGVLIEETEVYKLLELSKDQDADQLTSTTTAPASTTNTNNTPQALLLLSPLLVSKVYGLVTLTLVLVVVANAIPSPQAVVPPEIACPICRLEVISESDNPDPHQNYHFQQMTNNLMCGKGSGCEISKSQVEGQGVSLSASVTGIDWISAGFEVMEYTESGEAQTSQGNTGDTICVVWRAANTIYTVTSQKYGNCCRKERGPGSKLITSPNSDGLGSSAICGRNEQYHSKGHSYWNNSIFSYAIDINSY
ncbi:hypothetical protein FZEAL_705 [Fusarium zealandicum]|uniref:Uncharacterized protein n=1 Tax=Fusarium zealandicum TaxID=1053134 RepID=A0A8H4UUE9_9HYPO|nr:hypothetical protein FZEAL_705 [Fusarium zealandicum]